MGIYKSLNVDNQILRHILQFLLLYTTEKTTSFAPSQALVHGNFYKPHLPRDHKFILDNK